MRRDLEETTSSCAKCGTIPEDILILSCGHNLCLQCAANNLHREQIKARTNVRTVICDICGKATLLEPACARQLLSELSNLSFPRASPLPSQSSPSNKSVWALNKCPEHPDEDLNYFCEDCCSGPHCSECVVHGLHKTHRVLTLKNAFGMIKDRIESQVAEYGQKIVALERYNERAEAEKERLVSEGTKMKAQIEFEMLELERMIAKKREILCQSIDKIMQTDLSRLESERERFYRKKLELEQYRDELQEHVNTHDKVEVIDFYANTYDPEQAPKIDALPTESQKKSSLKQVCEEKLGTFLGKAKKIAEEISEISTFSLSVVSPPKVPSGTRNKIEYSFRKSTPTMAESQEIFEIFGRNLSNFTTKRFTARGTEIKTETGKKPYYTSPLKSLEMFRMKKISTSPSYRKYLQMKSSGKFF